MKKIILIVIGGLAVLIIGFILFVSFFWNKNFDAPLTESSGSSDSSIIARGKHLVYGPAYCASCHVPMDQVMQVEKGLEVPLSRGWELKIDPGTFRSANLTSDKETGIGKYTDAQIARVLRYGIGHDGKFLLPVMPYQGMCDEDIQAVISYLRTQEPVYNAIKPNEYTFLGKALLTFGLVVPEGPATEPPQRVRIDSSIAYGKYLARHVCECFNCHTERDLKTGEFIGEDFAGSMKFVPDAFSKGFSFIAPK